MESVRQRSIDPDPEFRSIFEALPAAILALRPDLTICAVTEEYLRATQTDRAAILGKGVFEVFPDNPEEAGADGVSALRASLQRVLATRRYDSMAVQKYDIREGGEGGFLERYWSPTNHPVLDEAGEVRYILHKVEDVTGYIVQRRLAEGAAPEDAGAQVPVVEVDIVRRAQEIQEANQSLRALRDELETRVQDRTQALADAMAVIHKHDAQLRQASKMEALGRLAGGIAHDFNNLLTVIYTSAEYLKARHGDAPQLDLLLTATERAAGLTRQLLSFSRQQVMAFQALDPGSVLRNSTALLKRVLGEDIDVKLFIAPELRTISADPSQLDQVILNLAINARDAMPRGGLLTLEAANVDLDEGYARTHPGTRPGPYVMLAVSDNGVGMDKETQARAFEPFFTTKDLGKGTGLGLATVFGIVQQSGGHVFLYSELGKGTTFKIYLPEAAHGAGAAEPLPMAGTPDAGESGEGRLLVVEDEDSVRNVLTTLLEEAGYEVHAVGNAAEAIQFLTSTPDPIDLMITDVIMPGMNGRELSGWVRESRPGIKVLFLSGYTNDAILRHGVLEDGLPFLQKPFTTGQLRRKVKEVLARPNHGR